MNSAASKASVPPLSKEFGFVMRITQYNSYAPDVIKAFVKEMCWADQRLKTLLNFTISYCVANYAYESDFSGQIR